MQEEEQRHATITSLVVMMNYAKLVQTAAKLGLVHLVLPSHHHGSSGNTYDLAALARRLMVENDPDAVRADLAEIADALDSMAQHGRPQRAGGGRGSMSRAREAIGDRGPVYTAGMDAQPAPGPFR